MSDPTKNDEQASVEANNGQPLTPLMVTDSKMSSVANEDHILPVDNGKTWDVKLVLIREFLTRYIKHCRNNDLKITAGYLSFITLLSLIPILTVMLSVISAFPEFTGAKELIEGFIFTNFLPASSHQIQGYIDSFVNNASKMTAVGIVFLIAVALSLISSVDTALNKIWRVQNKRKGVISFSIYWMVLTLGPVFIGASIGVTSYIVGMADSLTGGVIGLVLIELLPFIISAIAFLFLYMLVPNRDVYLQPALAGAVFAALMFELTKRGFALYITNFPSYQVIYGTLATIPILFIWIYLSWIVVLLGAEFTVMLEDKMYGSSQ